ncbi:MAG: hypothetical protein KDA37_13265 [Planctomycetales bacterium]|nr:hypothetical protein [Planctomycetales bacterium]
MDALLNEQTETQVAYFRERAEQSDPRQNTTIAIETYVDLLDRIGASDKALAESLRLMPEGVQPTGRAPSLMELALRAGTFAPLLELSRRRQDPLGYALSLLYHRLDAAKAEGAAAETRNDADLS